MKLPVLKPQEVVSILERLGFEKKRQSGSHVIFRHPKTGQIVPVPMHKGRDVKRGVLRSIMKQAGASVEELLEEK